MPRKRVSTDERAEQFVIDAKVPDDIDIAPIPEEGEEGKEHARSTLESKVHTWVRKNVQIDREGIAKTPKRKLFQRMCNGLAGLMVSWGENVFPDEWTEPFQVGEEVYQLAPTRKQYYDFFLPLGRIADRHVGLNIDNPDIDDAAKSLWVGILYASQLRTTMQMYKLLKEQEKIKEEYNHAYPQNSHARTFAGQAEVIDLSQHLPTTTEYEQEGR